MRISSTDVIEGGRVLYAIGKIKAATAWHAANGAPLQDNWRELVLSDLIRKAEDIDACPASAPMRQIRRVEEGRISGSSSPFQERR